MVLSRLITHLISVLALNDFWLFQKSNPPSKDEDFPSLRIISKESVADSEGQAKKT